MKDTKKTMHDIALLYYKEHLTQQQIAELLKTTRQNVSKMLTLAEQNGIVNIDVISPESTVADLEKELKEKTGLDLAVIGEASYDDEKLRYQAVIDKASEYIKSIVKAGNLKIGIAWGRTVEAVVDNMQKVKCENNCVFPLLGAGNGKTSCYSANKIVSDISAKIGGTAKLLPLPYIASEKDCTLLKQTDIYGEFENLWKDMDVSVVGIGNLMTLYSLQNNFGKKEIDKTIVGDIASHLITKDGKIVELYDNALCVSINELKNSKNVVAIAYGKEKVDSIISATKTGVINTLITDEFTAKEIIERIN